MSECTHFEKEDDYLARNNTKEEVMLFGCNDWQVAGKGLPLSPLPIVRKYETVPLSGELSLYL